MDEINDAIHDLIIAVDDHNVNAYEGRNGHLEDVHDLLVQAQMVLLDHQAVPR